MVSKIEPLRKISLVDQIVLQLRKEIISNEYALEGPFPSEKDLTLRFGTSRHTVRSALQTLAKEGVIEIAHGRGNIVKDFRLTIGIDVFPELIIARPEMITPDIFLIYRQHIMWLYDRILIGATLKAKPCDEAILMEIIDLYQDDLDVEAYWRYHTRFYRELLRIADNILLIMYYNSHLKMRQKMLETGIIRDIPAAPDYKREDRLKLAKAICTNNKAMVRRLMPSLEKILNKSLTEMFPKAKKK
jgi:DNA-binding FadR family transcriptional regulator